MRTLFVISLLILSACGKQEPQKETRPLDCGGRPQAVVDGKEYCCGTFADAIAVGCKNMYAVDLPDGRACVYICE